MLTVFQHVAFLFFSAVLWSSDKMLQERCSCSASCSVMGFYGLRIKFEVCWETPEIYKRTCVNLQEALVTERKLPADGLEEAAPFKRVVPPAGALGRV